MEHLGFPHTVVTMDGSLTRKQRLLDLNTKLGRELAKLRKARGLKQDEVAERMNFQRSTVSKIENGHHTLDAVEIPDYATALSVDPLELQQIIIGIVLEYDGRKLD